MTPTDSRSPDKAATDSPSSGARSTDWRSSDPREQFGRSADAYLGSAIHAQGPDLRWMVEHATRALGSLDGAAVLDVATGAGHAALAFARAGAAVVAMDLTPEMLDVARTLVERDDVVRALASPEAPLNARAAVAFRAGDAAAMPFADRSFDVVACRIAAHHFPDPGAFVAEAERVLRPGGRLIVVDNIAPESPRLDALMNEIEKRRDPSHVRAATLVEWMGWLTDARLAPERLERWRRTKGFRDWVDRSGMPAAAAGELERHILALDEEARRYFGVVETGGAIDALEHEVAMIAAAKTGT